MTSSSRPSVKRNVSSMAHPSSKQTPDRMMSRVGFSIVGAADVVGAGDVGTGVGLGVGAGRVGAGVGGDGDGAMVFSGVGANDDVGTFVNVGAAVASLSLTPNDRQGAGDPSLSPPMVT